MQIARATPSPKSTSVAGSVVGAKNPAKAEKSQQVTGTVEALDAAAGTFTVKGKKGNVDLKAGEKVKLGDFKVGDKVVVKYADGTASSVKAVKAAKAAKKAAAKAEKSADAAENAKKAKKAAPAGDNTAPAAKKAKKAKKAAPAGDNTAPAAAPAPAAPPAKK